ncbi:hypothetical protein FOA43_001377 [Brettanomyces nanus]|uniref:Structural maintenance of chromosomes protein n=1 Tax=Eeniella nana TaxID=13502 RepID=A0A875RY54_EENNA|nr:uncharacterized protein FOA43_001377 [Brettanomyces nanus]QPG74056.1 hypothetical protein FOA43_001377 [Brettanomyces nanus]
MTNEDGDILMAEAHSSFKKDEQGDTIMDESEKGDKVIAPKGGDTKDVPLSPPISSTETDTKSKISVVGLEPLDKEGVNMKPKEELGAPTTLSVSPVIPTQPGPPPMTKPTPRLVIEQLVLINFKSYAGKQVVGPFHPSFSAVVGPNGSGKSNVIDSLLFVFGFRASKMRQSKLSELIHNSENFQDLPFCRVDVHFKKVIDKFDENGHGYAEDVPKSQLVVSRKATRNNSSQFYINNHGSNFTEVRNLLKAQGIDLDHKRFLILQGEVESIAQMKPKAEKDSDDGLLEYLEDIIGTSKYKEPIGECLSQIDELNDICIEKERRFVFVEKSKNEMEEPKEKALAYLIDEKKYLEKKATYLQFSLRRDQQKLDTNKANLEQLKQSLETGKQESSRAKIEVKSLRTQHVQLGKEIDQIETQILTLKKAHKKIEREKVTMDEKIKHMQSSQKKASKSLESHKLALREAQATLSINQQNIEGYTDQEQELQIKLTEEKKELEKIKIELSDKTKDLSQRMNDLQRELQPWQNKIDSKQGELDVKNSELEILKKRLSEFVEEETSLRQAIEEKTELVKSKKKQIALLRQEKAHVNGQIELGEPEVADASKKLKEMERQLMSARQRAEDAKSRVSRSESRNRVLNALMHLKQTGRLQGFYGRLGDLGIIDDKYDVAVSTGGGSLDDMVVDTVECAQQCIQYIRKNGLGFGKFIVLNKLRQFNLQRIQTPENVSRLFDLIEPVEPKFAAAFYSSMYDTLVTEKLQVANRVAFGGRKRWRVVTMDGKLVDSSGAMSGGGSTVYRGAMKLRSKHPSGAHEITEHEMQKLVMDMDNKEKAFQEATTAFRQMEQALIEYKERLPQIDVESSKFDIEIRSLNEGIKTAEVRLKEMSKDSTQKRHTETEIESVNSVITGLSDDKAHLKEQSSGLQQKISEIEQRIMDIGGVKLKIQKAKVDSVEQKLEILGEKKSNDGVTASKAKNQISRLEKQISDNEKEIEECDESIASIQAEYKKELSSFQDSESHIRELQSCKDDKRDKKEKLEDDLEEVESKLNDLRKKEIESMGEIEKYELAVQGCEKRITNMTESAGTFQVRDIEELLGWMDPKERKQYSQNRESLPKLRPEELEKVDFAAVRQEVDRMEEALTNAEVDLDVLKEYSGRFTEYKERKDAFNESVSARDSAKERCTLLKEQRLDEFMAGFNAISSTLREMYHMITMGGNAELELVDSLDPFSEGILFSVMPPRKSWKNISNLSGGEKTLSSLALVFALHSYKPTPLYVMDEIDAALDFRNVSIIANYIKGRTKNAQFVVISLRNNMFELAERLVGIYKVNNLTRSVTLENQDMVQGDEQKDAKKNKKKIMKV